MGFRVFVITPDRLAYADDKPEGKLLDYLYAKIGCNLVQTVPVGGHDDEITAWADEEALYVADPEVNPVGSYAVTQLGGFTQIIHGTLVFTGGVDDDGNTLGLSEESVTMLHSIAHRGRNAVIVNGEEG